MSEGSSAFASAHGRSLLYLSLRVVADSGATSLISVCHICSVVSILAGNHPLSSFSKSLGLNFEI